MEKRERLTEQIILRVTPTEKKEIMNWVNKENTNLSDFIRNAIIYYINYLESSKKTDNSVE